MPCFYQPNYKSPLMFLIFIAYLVLSQSTPAIAYAQSNFLQVTTETASTTDSIDDDQDGIPNGIECLGFIGNVPLAVVNGSFEAPDIDTTFASTSKQWGTFPVVAVAYKAALVEGWSTTATDAEIEIWQNGFNGVSAYKGQQFAEINANQSATLYQDITTTPGRTMRWSFAHRGRTGVDTVALLIGPPQGPHTTLGSFQTGSQAWAVYQGDYVVPAGQTKSRFFYKAVTTANGNTTTGNFLDDIQFYTLDVCTLDTDGDGIVNSLDLDSDNDGILDILEAGLKDANGDGMVDDAAQVGSAAAVPDTDADQLPDFLDLDSDGDGIPDVVEAQQSVGYLSPSGQVAATGVDKAFGAGLPPIDTDGDGAPDYLDSDADNDTYPDTVEAKVTLSGVDKDQDGLDKGVDGDSKVWGPVNGKIAGVFTDYPNNGQEAFWRDIEINADTGVQTGGDGGLESGPLPGAPSTFIGGIGAETPGAGVDAAAGDATTSWHKARLLTDFALTLDKLMPTVGPNGTTPTPAIPVDVLAVTNAPDAKAIDFVDGAGNVQAAVLGILSVGKPYVHDYGVCNRFKGYEFDEVAPIAINVPPDNTGWFWHSHGNKGATIHEDALLFHIFVNENDKQFHIDSRWTQDAYGQNFDFQFDYVFNMQIWSNNLITSRQLLQAILLRLTALDEGSWQVIYHNEAEPTGPQLFVRQVRYAADSVYLDLTSLTETEQPVRIYGAWRNHLDRQTLQSFEKQVTIPATGQEIALNFPGLLDATIYIESNGFTDKVYTGGGLWFDVANNAGARADLSLGVCRTLDEIDTTDLLLAGCASVQTSNSTRIDEVGVGRTLNPNGRPVDVSPYKALRFWAKGDGAPVRVILESTGITDADYYQTVFTPDSEWRQYIIPLSQFQQRGFGQAVTWTGTDVKAVVWVNAEVTGRSLSLGLDQVSFTNNALLQATALAQNNSDTGPRLVQMAVPEGADVTSMTLHYSLDGGRTFAVAPMNLVSAASANGLFQGELPAQPLGSDIRYYGTATHANGYVSQIPVDAPNSFYRYRVDDRTSLLVNDFGGSHLRNRLDGSSGLFNHPASGGQLLAYRYEQQLLLDYAVTQEGQYAGYYTKLPQMDVSAYTTLNLLVRGEQGGEQLHIGLRDAHNYEPRLSVGDLLPGGLTTEWQWVQVPLASFNPAFDRTAVASLSLTFYHDYAPTSGRVYLQEMRFTGLATPVVIDHFDDSQFEQNGQGSGYWTMAPNSTLIPNILVGDATKNSGAALRLDYTIGANGYGLWRSNLNNANVPADSILTAWVKGGNQGVSPRFYLADDAMRAGVALADYVTLSDRWQLVQVPLNAFTTQGLNPANLTGFEVVFEFGTGSGVFWLDNVQVGGQGAPQADLRMIHLRNTDRQPLALHLPNGSDWSANSTTPWLFTQRNGAGPDTLALQSMNWNLAPGVHTGNLSIQSSNGQTEQVTVVLTITEPGAPATQLYLPMVAR